MCSDSKPMGNVTLYRAVLRAKSEDLFNELLFSFSLFISFSFTPLGPFVLFLPPSPGEKTNL